MQQLLPQVFLPLILALIILAMGLGLQPSDFRRIVKRPKASIIGLSLQIFFLPTLALILIALLPLEPISAAGLFLLSLCPGGATSNLFSYLARGDVALSVTLTGFVSLLSPLILPIAFVTYLQLMNVNDQSFSMPLLPAIKQLTIITLLPISVGMSIRFLFPNWANSVQPKIRTIATVAMVLVVMSLLFTNIDIVLKMLSINALAVLMLSSLSLVIAYAIAQKLKFDEATRRCIAIEVGVQNAGTAMMVALTILARPELAIVPLMYGLLMNIPAFLFVYWAKNKTCSPISLQHDE